MATVSTPQPVQEPIVEHTEPLEVTVYSHSPLFYWWPVWVMGYVMAALTYWQGVYFTPTEGAEISVLIHPNKSLGVLFTVTFLLVILMTHATVRGNASLTVIVSLIAVTLFLAYMDWWEPLMRTMGLLAIYMNLGFYVFFSTAVFLVWFLAVFVFDRLESWIFRPGQMILRTVFGAGEQAYDTRGMMVYKLRDDLFRHWILGLGSGDLHIAITGARKEEFVVPNVLFIGTKLDAIQRLAAMKPNQGTEVVVQETPAEVV